MTGVNMLMEAKLDISSVTKVVNKVARGLECRCR
jgi:hypothetical protein